MATQPGREQLLAIGYAIFLAHGVQPGGLPGFVQSLDDESGHTRLELIGVRLEPAMLGLHESESKGVEGLLCDQPTEAQLTGIDKSGRASCGERVCQYVLIQVVYV